MRFSYSSDSVPDTRISRRPDMTWVERAATSSDKSAVQTTRRGSLSRISESASLGVSRALIGLTISPTLAAAR